jgi:hypothetical protein
MARLKVDALMTYHGGPVLKGGGEAMQAVVREF